MDKLNPHLWFDTQAREAAEFYTTLFPDSRIDSVVQIHGTPSGDCDVVTLRLCDQPFQFISAGPLFQFNPSISFLVACSTREEVDRLWAELSQGGQVLMPLAEYPFSSHYGWTSDRYGLSWQIMFMGDYPFTQRITPTLMFVGAVCGQAEPALDFYTSVFRDARKGNVNRYGAGEEPDREGTVRHATFVLEGVEMAAMDSAHPHDFKFNEAISFVVHCADQAEIDYYWEKLSADPQSEQCGWLKDRFGVSWQIVPASMQKFLEGDEATRHRITRALLQMKKFDVAKLERAAAGR